MSTETPDTFYNKGLLVESVGDLFPGKTWAIVNLVGDGQCGWYGPVVSLVSARLGRPVDALGLHKDAQSVDEQTKGDVTRLQQAVANVYACFDEQPSFVRQALLSTEPDLQAPAERMARAARITSGKQTADAVDWWLISHLLRIRLYLFQYVSPTSTSTSSAATPPSGPPEATVRKMQLVARYGAEYSHEPAVTLVRSGAGGSIGHWTIVIPLDATVLNVGSIHFARASVSFRISSCELLCVDSLRALIRCVHVNSCSACQP